MVVFRQSNETWQTQSWLTLVREMTDTDRRSTVGDTAEMCDLKRTIVQCIFKASIPEALSYITLFRS